MHETSARLSRLRYDRYKSEKVFCRASASVLIVWDTAYCWAWPVEYDIVAITVLYCQHPIVFPTGAFTVRQRADRKYMHVRVTKVNCYNGRDFGCWRSLNDCH
jgi:hypothetical protein